MTVTKATAMRAKAAAMKAKTTAMKTAAMKTTPPLFPFAALVALDEMQLALQLAAIDRRLSVLLRGDKGAGKSTAARGLGALLGDAAPFVNLPVGATEDRILGGLDLARALNGEPALKPGLLAAAHGGVLYIDEVNLLPDHLADAMLDAVASGVHIVEREGFSASQDAEFVLIGSMNPEEGALRPQLLDRFALVVDVAAPVTPAERRAAVERRLAFDRHPGAFIETWRERTRQLALTIARAQAALARLDVDAALLDAISEQVCAHGVRSLRADLAIVRASRALAALEEAPAVTVDHVARVLPLALRHRVAAWAPSSPPPPALPQPSPSAQSSAPQSLDDERSDERDDEAKAERDDGRNGDGKREAKGDAETAPRRVFASLAVPVPRLVAPAARDVPGRAVPSTRSGAAAAPSISARGPVIGSRRSEVPTELAARATLVHAIAQTGTARPRREDLHEQVRTPVAGRRYLFVIDASGSLAAQQRMRLVKGAVEGLLGHSVRRRDEVAIVAFRGASADVVLPPTSDLEQARQALRYLPTGGRTPLAHALDVAAGLVTDDSLLVLLTDGRANVPSRTDDPWADALESAARLCCPALVVDSESGAHVTGRAADLAARMRATHIRLDDLDRHALIDLLQTPSSPAAGRTS